MFGWVDFRKDRKKRMKNRRENEWKGCLVERGRGEKSDGAQLFSLWVYQNSIFSKQRENWREKEKDVYWTKLPFSIPQPIFCLFLTCLFGFFFFFFFFYLDKISSCLLSTFNLVWFWFWFWFWFCFFVFFFGIKFCTIHVSSFCLFLSFYLFLSF